MKRVINFTLIFFLLTSYLDAQIVPVQNSEEELNSLNVKAISTSYIQDSNSEQLIFRKEFNQEGDVISKYQLSLWDAVSYSHTTHYQYNDKGLLIEEYIIQKILNLSERDEEYIKIFGDTPLNEKVLYYYNEQDLLSKKAVYTFEEAELDSKSSPDQTVNYQYEDGVLISEESTSSDEKFFNKNYLIKYSHDSAGIAIQKSMAYGKEKELQRNYLFHYDNNGRLIEEQVIDSSIPHNNKHLKYEYNSKGLISNKYVFDEMEQEFELETNYQYDVHGNAISGDRDVKYEYYTNGLIKSETWTDPISDETIRFKTSYEFFER